MRIRCITSCNYIIVLSLGEYVKNIKKLKIILQNQINQYSSRIGMEIMKAIRSFVGLPRCTANDLPKNLLTSKNYNETEEKLKIKRFRPMLSN